MDCKLCKSVIMEIRPCLQSVNVFITLFTPDQVTVNLNSNSFDIVIGTSIQKINCQDFCIVPNSLSCFRNNNECISFRFSTENAQQQLGTLKFEFIRSQMHTFTFKKSDCFLKPNTIYDISCGNCFQSFSKVTFERILPLPENSDFDWFCHGDQPKLINLIPKLKDAFYSESFVHLNSKLLDGFMRDNSILVCARCLVWIGNVLDKEVYKIWFNTVTFNDHRSFPLEDCFKIINQVLSNSLLSSLRLIFRCKSSHSHTDVILLWILEAKLKIHFNKTLDVAKVLFKYESDENDLVNEWMADKSINVINISKQMIFKLLEHLYNMNQFIPKDFSISGEFYISYLMMYNK